MNETPRTDALWQNAEYDALRNDHKICRWSDFARELELEITELKAFLGEQGRRALRIAELERDLNEANKVNETAAQTIARLAIRLATFKSALQKIYDEGKGNSVWASSKGAKVAAIALEIEK